jgi:hypothetical protein
LVLHRLLKDRVEGRSADTALFAELTQDYVCRLLDWNIRYPDITVGIESALSMSFTSKLTDNPDRECAYSPAGNQGSPVPSFIGVTKATDRHA